MRFRFFLDCLFINVIYMISKLLEDIEGRDYSNVFMTSIMGTWFKKVALDISDILSYPGFYSIIDILGWLCIFILSFTKFNLYYSNDSISSSTFISSLCFYRMGISYFRTSSYEKEGGRGCVIMTYFYFSIRNYSFLLWTTSERRWAAKVYGGLWNIAEGSIVFFRGFFLSNI